MTFAPDTVELLLNTELIVETPPPLCCPLIKGQRYPLALHALLLYSHCSQRHRASVYISACYIRRHSV